MHSANLYGTVIGCAPYIGLSLLSFLLELRPPANQSTDCDGAANHRMSACPVAPIRAGVRLIDSGLLLGV
ncbi:hypothetical protein FKM82_026122 [Ascaphus truei]